MRELVLLPITKFRVIRIIQVVDKDRLIGDLPYLRYFSCYKSGDIVDQLILLALKKQFADSKMIMVDNIIYKNDLNNYLESIESGSLLNFYINFNNENVPGRFSTKRVRNK